jgi:hypothetical protein
MRDWVRPASHAVVIGASIGGQTKIPPATAPELPPPDTDFTNLRDEAMGRMVRVAGRSDSGREKVC